ncbi:uncharacterized protein LOC111248262 isoform X2 [Varroa destructor]|uniref:Uncharacterized protein n=1 Tax=Varroa destructor TaxID=109461 RepID=A0A7M7M7T0_VARDE|nr:uncharacterized protein LOC111248262 isoform X2 [Varroa destructor]
MIPCSPIGGVVKMFRIEEKDGDTYIYSVVNKKLLCVLRDNRFATKTGLTFVDTKIVSVHESLRRREALKNGKYESSLKKSSFPVRLPPEEPEPPRTKKYFLSKFGLQNVQRQQKIFEDLRPSKTFLEEVPFSSITGRRVMKLRPTNVNPNEAPRYDRYVNRKCAPPLDCITYPNVYRGGEYPQAAPIRLYLFGKRPKDELLLVKRLRPFDRLSRRS